MQKYDVSDHLRVILRQYEIIRWDGKCHQKSLQNLLHVAIPPSRAFQFCRPLVKKTPPLPFPQALLNLTYNCKCEGLLNILEYQPWIPKSPFWGQGRGLVTVRSTTWWSFSSLLPLNRSPMPLFQHNQLINVTEWYSVGWKVFGWTKSVDLLGTERGGWKSQLALFESVVPWPHTSFSPLPVPWFAISHKK